jgi:ketosteroid isomerase-like protein
VSPQDVRERVLDYYAAVTSGDIDRIAAMFAAAAEMRDPVGQPPATDDAARRQRYEGIPAVFESFAMTAEAVEPGGNEAAARWQARGRTKTGREVAFAGISLFEFDGQGRIARMSAFWDRQALAASLAG